MVLPEVILQSSWRNIGSCLELSCTTFLWWRMRLKSWDKNIKYSVFIAEKKLTFFGTLYVRLNVVTLTEFNRCRGPRRSVCC